MVEDSVSYDGGLSVGMKIWRLKLLYVAGKGQKKRWLCRCECLAIKEICPSELRNNRTVSCGCFHKDWLSSTKRKHGESGEGPNPSPEYKAWNTMKHRCYNPRDISFHNYGGRGIEVCKEWRESFEVFLRDVGRKPSPEHSLDRIENDHGYEPGNVRWATREEQNRNKRNTKLLNWSGEYKTLTEWASVVGMRQSVLWKRIYRGGWSLERALTEPLRQVRRL